jgi:acyl carrier protein
VEPRLTRAQIKIFLVERLANELAVPTDEICPSTSFERMGIDSLAAVSMVGDLEIRLDRELDAALVLRHPTIDALAQFLSSDDLD